MQLAAKRAVLFAVVLVAVAVIAVAMFRDDARPGFEVRAQEPGIPSAGTPALGLVEPGLRTDAPPPALAPRDSRKPLDRVGSISQLLARANQAGATGQDLQQLMDAAAYCAYHRVPAPPSKRKLSPQQEVVRKFEQDFAQAFCNAAVPGPGELESRMVGLNSEDEVLQANILMVLEGQEALSAGVPAAERMLHSAKSPAAIARAADFLLMHDQNVPQAAGRPFPPSIDTRQEMVDVQRLALAMVGCNLRGGCGVGGLYTALECINHCRPGVSLPQVWAAQYSPEAIAYARALATAIENDPSRTN